METRLLLRHTGVLPYVLREALWLHQGIGHNEKKTKYGNFQPFFLGCGLLWFWGVILLLVITKIYEPVTIEKSREDLQQLIVKLERELNELRGDSTVINRDLKEIEEQLSENKKKKNKLAGDLSEMEGEFSATRAMSEESTGTMNSLLSAKQSLTEEMKRLLKDYNPIDDSTVGGIPVDSEYIIFVIDTSGSMYQGPWNLVIQKITETLSVYPELKAYKF
ncbi:MAG: hypothetical protein Ct9H300mP6_08780 [Gammaproteobacteria bacterium]|nr:MAG: hypothetical protein Ct9H300mP6_08780 [Gammaproteobacteria bacterium]